MAEQQKYLDSTGLEHLVGKIKTELAKHATLDDSGKVPPSQLPSYVDDVVEFSGIVSDITLLPASTILMGRVVYSANDNCFALSTGMTGNPKYYNNWQGRENYEDDSFVPLSGKIFVDTETNKSYRWSGSDLVEISSSLALGETAGSAYAGDKGKKNADDIAANKQDIAAIKNGDLPLVIPEITGGWSVADANDTDTSTTYGAENITIDYGFKVRFRGCMKWTQADGYKNPTAMSGGDWGSKELPASGENSAEILTENITTDKTFTASIKAPKQGLVLKDGIIRQADASDFDVKSKSIKVHFQFSTLRLSDQEESSSVFLEKNIATSATYLQDSRVLTLTDVSTEMDQYFYYAYPAILGELTKITMNDATPLLNDGFTLEKVSVELPGSKAVVEYNVYRSIQKGAFTNAKLEFA